MLVVCSLYNLPRRSSSRNRTVYSCAFEALLEILGSASFVVWKQTTTRLRPLALWEPSLALDPVHALHCYPLTLCTSPWRRTTSRVSVIDIGNNNPYMQFFGVLTQLQPQFAYAIFLLCVIEDKVFICCIARFREGKLVDIAGIWPQHCEVHLL